MIVPCPHCQARLNLPQEVEGREVRCPNCRQVFRADGEALAESVQARPQPLPSPRDDHVQPRTQSPARYRDDDDETDIRRRRHEFDDHFDRPEVERDVENIVENAKAQTRSAGFAMLAAFAFTSFSILGETILNAVMQMEVGAVPGAMPVVLIAGCGIAFYAVPLVFIGLASRDLFTLGSRGIIITAIVMNFFVAFLLGGSAAINALLLGVGELPFPFGQILMSLVMNAISAVLNVAAAVMAIRALRLPDVTEAYAMCAEQTWRRRRW